MRRALTEEQKAKSEERRGKFRALAKQIADLSQERREEMAAQMPVVTIEGRQLSVHNMCLLCVQNPHVTMVGGFRQWLKAGRAVRKGEHGLMIWAPRGTAKDEAAGMPGVQDEMRFLIVTVFDVSQTEEV